MPLDPKWAKFAENDCFTAEVLLREEVWNQVCFHSQKCVEKLLKGSLPAEARPRTHKIADLVRLTDFLALDDKLKADLRLLDRFYIPSRYPDALPGTLEDGMPSERDAVVSIQTAKSLLSVLN
jgi:HEPN domain-containing protein